MKVSRIHIKNFRSIVDSGEVEIEPSVTVLIGKNEQGKTNFLKGVKAFNTDHLFTPGDLPNHLRPSLETQKPSEIPIVTLWFSLDPQDRQKLKGVDGIDSALEVKCSKHYDNSYYFWLVSDGGEESLKFIPLDFSSPISQIKAAATTLKANLLAHGQRVPEFAANNEKIEQFTAAINDAIFSDPSEVEDVIKTFMISVKALTGIDQPILDDIATASTEFDKAKDIMRTIVQTDASLPLKQSLPRFILHSTKADQIPNEVNVNDFVKDPDSTSKGMANLCRAAGLSVQKVRELAATSDTTQRETYEDHYKASISGGLNEFWTQQTYTVHFRIEKDRLSVSISDENYIQRIPPSDRSDGFQWYLSFYATLLNDAGISNETILLLDNPGLELHLDGQRDIKRFLEEKVSLDSQVIYVTHSPAMVDPFNLKQVRAVELRSNQRGTSVTKFVLTGGSNSDLLEPVRSAIGMSIVSSLVLNEWNILVEGAADKPIIEGIFVQHYKELRDKVLVNGSLSESKDAFLVQFYHRAALPYVVVLDADSGGRDLFGELKKAGIPEDRIVKLEEVFAGRSGEFAIEDILSSDFYYQAVNKAYPSNPITMPKDSNKKRANLYEQAFKDTYKIGFNKRRVAEMVKMLLGEGKEDQATRESLGKLSTVLINKLKDQVSETKEANAGAEKQPVDGSKPGTN